MHSKRNAHLSADFVSTNYSFRLIVGIFHLKLNFNLANACLDLFIIVGDTSKCVSHPTILLTQSSVCACTYVSVIRLRVLI